MKKLQIMLLILLLMTMTACGNMPEMPSSDSKAEVSQEEIASTVPAESQTEVSSSQEASAETNTDTPDSVRTKPETEETSDKEAADKPKQNKTSSSQAVNDPSPDEINEKGSGTPEPEEEKPQEQPQPEESKPASEPPVETKTEESNIQEPEPEVEPEPAPQFDIDYWIGYAQSVATSKGLVLESTAVDCWDNPIEANSDCIYLERDINSRLNRYATDGETTDVWIWYECIGENEYLIYIGYA